ncbi:hypothetical protein [Priestia taiwanensis]|uniref:Uncharacterized protein n=1 Tax=Priestia taiwanensis TaxID=1347902 RepID=A0A917AIC6_9BACI|nr:hypothetical protein [Priestia taiwanensis]MBM7361582.1 hypothetical protein [Priestia taiwanensis]GGE55297.1 hypothetical protein GCM10007140_02060 [Priestia taiwanensis]
MLRSEENYDAMNWWVTTGVYHPLQLRIGLIFLIGICSFFSFVLYLPLYEAKMAEKSIYELIINNSYSFFVGLLVIAVILYHRTMAMKYQGLQFLIFFLLSQVLGFQFLFLGYFFLATIFAETITKPIIWFVVISGLLLLIFSIVRFRSSIAKGKYVVTNKKNRIIILSSPLTKPLAVLGLVTVTSALFRGAFPNITLFFLSVNFVIYFYIQMYYLPYLFTVVMCKIKFRSFRVEDIRTTYHNSNMRRSTKIKKSKNNRR